MNKTATRGRAEGRQDNHEEHRRSARHDEYEVTGREVTGTKLSPWRPAGKKPAGRPMGCVEEQHLRHDHLSLRTFETSFDQAVLPVFERTRTEDACWTRVSRHLL